MTRQSPAYRTNRNLFSNHYLSNRLRETDAWTEPDTAAVRDAYEEIHALYEDCADRVDDYNEAQLERNFIRPVFEALGIPFEIEETVARVNRRPDYGFFETETAADAAFDREDFYAESVAVADAKSWGRKLDTRGEKRREFENPSYQIHVYLEETAASWAVLTNGRQWRLYYGPTSHRLDSYYEIDLPALLDHVAEGGEGSLAAFREFYLFFRHAAFVPEGGDCFLDDVYEQSNRFSEDLSADLQDNIYEAIRVLAEGFLDGNEDLDESDLDLIHDSSLIYLYRLIFVLYAESEERDLLPTDNDVYESEYSLNSQKEAVAENLDATETAYYAWQTRLWDQLDELFELIDQGSAALGIPPEKLQIPAYNGGLFDTDPGADASRESAFLATHEVGDSYLAQVIDLLSRQEREDRDSGAASGSAGGASAGGGTSATRKTFVDYSSLDVRQLGSIYEGLLEYQLNRASEPQTLTDESYEPAGADDEIEVAAGEVYLTTDSGERKATGSYYTPEYVVEYIVEETLGPQVASIREELMAENVDRDGGGFAERFTEEILDLTVLDPAMGSGHFLVNAVDYLAREIIDAREQQDREAVDDDRAGEIQVTTEDGERRDINWARRQVAKQCLYGVDVNPLATELAKVSLWLRTLAAGKPLAFLDHHLKTGNSLVGSNIYEVLSNGDGGQATLDDFRAARARTLSHVEGLMSELVGIENDDLASIKRMQATYQEMQSDPLYRRLFELANVHTAERFGLDVPEGAYRTMADAIESEDEWTEQVTGEDWFVSAQAMADAERFFHWELEFPEVFMGEDSNGGESGFDAIIGNPPYAKIDADSGQLVDRSVTSDLYAQFISKSQSFVHSDGFLSFITPTSWETGPNYEETRQNLIQSGHLRSLINLPYDVFEEAYVDTSIFVWQNINTTGDAACMAADLSGTRQSPAIAVKSPDMSKFNLSDWKDAGIIVIDINWIRMSNRLQDLRTVGDVAESTRGVLVTEESRTSNKADTPICLDSFQRYETVGETAEVDYNLLKEAPAESNMFKGSRLLVRRLVSRSDRLLATYATDHFVSKKDVYIFKSKKYNEKFLLALMNSSLISWWQFNIEMSASKDDFRQVTLSGLRSLPLPKNTNVESAASIQTNKKLDRIEKNVKEKTEKEGVTNYETLITLVDRMTKLVEKRSKINTSIRDYISGYSTDKKLVEIGLVQPVEGASKSPITATREEYNNLRIVDADVRQDGNSVVISVKLEYKPEDAGRGEYEPLGEFKAIRITNIDNQKIRLIDSYVPYAIKNPEEMSNYRKNATKNIQPIDRLRSLTLPRVADVEQGLDSYRRAKERADELDAKIQRTDELIDEIVYDLYDLTDEEIEIVEESVGSD